MDTTFFRDVEREVDITKKGQREGMGISVDEKRVFLKYLFYNYNMNILSR